MTTHPAPEAAEAAGEGRDGRPGGDRSARRRDRTRLPGLRLLTDPIDRESHRYDETAYNRAGLPGAVVFPTTTADVAELVRIAAELRIPVVPRGAGTGLSGGAAGIDGCLTIVFTAMDRILEIDRENLVAVVQPGVINADLKAAVAAEGLFYPPDPASYELCSIGGNLGTNAGGLCCVKYGQTRNSVLSLEVVMADGAVIRTGGKNVKDVAGYSLTHLFVGSQGTLAITTEATLRLRPAPPPRSTMLAFFPTLDSAGDAVAGIAAAGLSPVTLELLDRFTIAAVDDMNNLGLDRTAAAMLMIESDLPGVAATDELERAEAACRVAGATDVIRAADAQEADWLRQAGGRRITRWSARRGPDGGHRRARARASRTCSARSSGSRRGTRSGSGRSAMPATATCTRTSSSSVATRPPRPRPRRSRRTSIAPRSTWAAPSRPSTASAAPGANGSRSSADPTRCG